ncbi:hypothetical protein GA0074692_1608 [Micromonospora pallida]|uniref:Uncharacterized protein n=1 Tax=Micromonospora pallida TaxID=145854 RepID=A0A1C6S274_9ACTN|nr:hypothetical protein GA0074692_1608 [Micromonospora pallida]
MNVSPVVAQRFTPMRVRSTGKHLGRSPQRRPTLEAGSSGIVSGTTAQPCTTPPRQRWRVLGTGAGGGVSEALEGRRLGDMASVRSRGGCLASRVRVRPGGSGSPVTAIVSAMWRCPGRPRPPFRRNGDAVGRRCGVMESLRPGGAARRGCATPECRPGGGRYTLRTAEEASERGRLGLLTDSGFAACWGVRSSGSPHMPYAGLIMAFADDRRRRRRRLVGPASPPPPRVVGWNVGRPAVVTLSGRPR